MADVTVWMATYSDGRVTTITYRRDRQGHSGQVIRLMHLTIARIPPYPRSCHSLLVPQRSPTDMWS
jgi:hypothetical protein